MGGSETRFAVDVVRIREAGQVCVQAHAGARVPALRAYVLLRDEKSTLDGRITRIAKLVDPDGSGGMIDVPPLIDACLISASAKGMAMSGVELHDDIGRTISYAQSWWLTRPEKPMTVAVMRLVDAGWQLPRWQLSFQRAHIGILQVTLEQVPSLRRHARVARLLMVDGQTNTAFPPMYDVQLVESNLGFMTLSGIEQGQKPVGGGLVDCAQMWRVELHLPDNTEGAN